MRKLLVWLALVVIAAATGFLGAYYYAAGTFDGLRFPGGEAPVEPAPREDAGENDGGYRIKLMEEASTDRLVREVEREEVTETVETVSGGEIVRRPLGGTFLDILLDCSASLGGEEGREVLAGVARAAFDFAAKPPEGVTVMVRSMGGGPKGTCDESLLLAGPGSQGSSSRAAISPAGPRNVSGAMYQAAGDLATYRGEKGLVVISAGDEECGQWPCETAGALFGTKERIRSYLLRLQVQAAEEPAGTPPAEEEPVPASGGPVEEPLACLAESGGGFEATVRDREAVKASLERVVSDLSRNVVVRLFVTRDRELAGGDDLMFTPWSVEAAALDGTFSQSVSSGSLPARFELPPGRYRITGTYGEAVSTMEDVAVAPGEKVEARLRFGHGQLVVMEGERRIPGVVERCQVVVKVYRADELLQAVAEKCGLPSQFGLPPGRYSVCVEVFGAVTRAVPVDVSGGRNSVITVDYDGVPRIIGVDKR